MFTSNAIAQILGIIFLLISITLIFRKKYTRIAISEIMKSPGLIWTLAFIALVFGAVLVTLVPFSGFLNILLIILGLISLLKGFYLLWSPENTVKLYEKMNKKGKMISLSGIVALVLSILLLISSF